ncbi:MAG: single-stranded DNA-binding protein [Nocardioidaceae bacterium]
MTTGQPSQRATREDNTVRLRGRVCSPPASRSLPSGTEIVTVRISVGRARTMMTSGSRQRVDWVDCTAWTARLRRTVQRWSVGDLVEVEGSLRRRHQPGGSGVSRVDVEVLAARAWAPGSDHP